MTTIAYAITDDEWASLQALAARFEIDPMEVAKIVLVDQLRIWLQGRPPTKGPVK